MIAAAYARYSSDNQRAASIDAQLRAINTYAEHTGDSIRFTYSDEAISGTSDDRPQFKRMMEDARRHCFQLIIVHEFSRAFRNARDAVNYRDELRRLGVRLVSVLEPLEDSPMGRFMEILIAGKDQMYSEHLAIETMKGLKENAYNCEFCGGRAPLGYDVVDKKYVVNYAEAETVRMIFRMYAEGAKYDDIIYELRGVNTKGGSPFGRNSLNSILTNEKYRGVFTFNLRSYGAGKHRNAEEDIIRVPGGIPQIIDDITWEAVQRRMQNNKARGAHKAKREYLLSGLCTCAECGARLQSGHSSNAKGDYSYYRCPNKHVAVRADQLEDIVLKQVDETCSMDMDGLAKKLYESQDLEAKKTIDARIRVIDKETERLVEAIAKGVAADAIYARLKSLDTEKNQLLNIHTQVYTQSEIRTALSLIKAPKEKPGQRIAIRAIVENITVSKAECSTAFSILRVAGACNAKYLRLVIPFRLKS